jgi:hypothetical protein
LYFDPEEPIEIFKTLETYLINSQLRLENANASFAKAQQYSWSICANETFSFVNKVASNYHDSLFDE